ncbi:MAG: hypothetical protein AAF975_06160 [Spirochaetota bacterium]
MSLPKIRLFTKLLLLLVLAPFLRAQSSPSNPPSSSQNTPQSTPESLSQRPPQSLSDLLNNVLKPRNRLPDQSSKYPPFPPPLTFGNTYYDDYAISPAERPVPQKPALPLSPEEQELQSRYQTEQAKAQRQQKQIEKKRFNKELRVGFAMDVFIGIPHLLKVSNPSSGTLLPIPYVHSPLIRDVSPQSNEIPIFSNYYKLSLLLHIFPFMELSLGLGYQSNSFTSPVFTTGDLKTYIVYNRILTKEAFYAVTYQKDIVFYELGISLLLPWVLNGKNRSVLGLSLSGSVALGTVTKAEMGLARPTLPEELITLFSTNPLPSYKIIEKFPLNYNPVMIKLMASLGAYLEIVGFRLHLGYSLRIFPQKLYPHTRYHVAEDFAAGNPVRYSTISFPELYMVHSINLSIQYWLNPFDLLGKRSIYRKAQKRKRPSGTPTMRRRIG